MKSKRSYDSPKFNILKRYIKRKNQRLSTNVESSTSGIHYFSFIFSFAATMVIVLYIAYQLGSWLDRTLHTSPWCIVILVVLCIVATLRVMIHDLDIEQKKAHVKSKPNERSKQC